MTGVGGAGRVKKSETGLQSMNYRKESIPGNVPEISMPTRGPRLDGQRKDNC